MKAVRCFDTPQKAIYTIYLAKKQSDDFYINPVLRISAGRDRSVGIATRYGLDGSGIESSWGRDFPHPSTPAMGPAQVLVERVQGLFRGRRAVGKRR
jgi:hypothetical protein